MREATFAAKQLPRQILTHYSGVDLLKNIDAVIYENKVEGEATDSASCTVEFKDQTFDQWRWREQAKNWSSWVKEAEAQPIED